MPSAEHMHGWYWLRAYYFERCKDDVILDGVWPAVGCVDRSAGGSIAYFQRDWMGGPNILLGLRTAEPDRDVEQVADAIRRYMARNPSSTQLSAAEILRRMASLRVQEHRLKEPQLAPQPNNSVRVDGREPYSPFLVDDGLKHAVRRFLSLSASLVVRWLTLVRARKRHRHDICLQVMVSLAWLADPEQLRSHLSFGSHAQAFLRVQDRGGQLVRAFAARYDGAGGERVRALLRSTTDSLRRRRDLSPEMAAFVDLLSATLRDIHDGVRDGRYRPVPASTVVGDPDRGAVNYRRLIELLDASTAFRAWQITISLLYQVLNQLGMTAAERFLACYLLSRAAEDVYGQPGSLIRQAMEASGDHRDMFTFFDGFDNRDADSDACQVCRTDDADSE